MLLKKQEANAQRKQGLGTRPGPERGTKHGPGCLRGSCSKGQGDRASRGSSTEPAKDTGIQKSS